MVDNTFATPYNQRPLAAGADVVIHSATKYLGGHSDVIGGCVIGDAATAERLWYKRTMLGGSLDPFAAWLLLRGMKTLAGRQMSGPGGMVAFEMAGGREAGVRLVESTRLALLAVSLGGAETLIEHPASMSHAMLSDEELRQAGIPPGLIRLSVGIEDADDLIADLRQALAGQK